MLVNMVQVYAWPTCNVVELDKDKEIEISSVNLHPISKSNFKPRRSQRSVLLAFRFIPALKSRLYTPVSHRMQSNWMMYPN